MRKCLGIDVCERSLFRASVPVHCKSVGGRMIRQQPFILPDQHLRRALQRHGRDALTLAAWPANSVTPDLEENAVVRAHGHDNVVCFGLFVDAAPYSKSDSIYAWYINILPDDKRYRASS